MSKFIRSYIARLLQAEVSDEMESKIVNGINETIGKLSIWESENLHPGMRYIQFQPNQDDFELQTSCGELHISENQLSICTQNRSNTYIFELIKPLQTNDLVDLLHEKYWHICEVCGKKELLSSKEAFDQGWDYPGPDGIYKQVPNYGFRMIVPRTCGNCLIKDSLYWKMQTGELTKDTNKKYEEYLERIISEPWSLIDEESEVKS